VFQLNRNQTSCCFSSSHFTLAAMLYYLLRCLIRWAKILISTTYTQFITLILGVQFYVIAFFVFVLDCSFCSYFWLVLFVFVGSFWICSVSIITTLRQVNK
jgi:hypothetical protein